MVKDGDESYRDYIENDDFMSIGNLEHYDCVVDWLFTALLVYLRTKDDINLD